MMPLQTYTLRAGIRVPVDPPPLFRQPAAGVTLPDWIYMIMASLLLRGNAYGVIAGRDQAGYPTQIELQNPDDVQVRRQPDGSYGYFLRGVQVRRENMFHIPAYRLPGLPVGLSPLQQAAVTINRAMAIQQFALGYFVDAPNPKSVVTSDQPITAEHAKTLKERIKTAITGRDILVMGAGAKFLPLSVSPEESQFLEAQKAGAAEICGFFGCPPQKIPGAAVANSLTYSTVEMSSIDLLTFTCQWWITCLEAALAPLLPGQKHARFDPSVLLRTDFETTMKATAIGIASKQMTPDEARQMRDAAPLTVEQKNLLDLVPLTISPTGMPKALPIAAQEQDPLLAGVTDGGNQ
jgi:HK97 family phage portal protein